MQTEGFTYRETFIQIANNFVYWSLCRMHKKVSMDHGLLCKAFKAIKSETWEAINQLIIMNQFHQGLLDDPDTVQTDTTVVESNIHYPTDSSLLWDCYAEMAKKITFLRKFAEDSVTMRFHLRKIKKIYLNITHFSNSKSKSRQRKVRTWNKELIIRVETTVKKALFLCGQLSNHEEIMSNEQAKKKLFWLQDRFPVMKQIIDVARRRPSGESVPNKEKILSIYEPHTELIIRGRREKPVEFGHKLVLTQTRDKMITDYKILPQNRPDSDLIEEILDRHKDRFGREVKNVVADKGFYPGAEISEDCKERTENFFVPKHLGDLGSSLMVDAQKFRAGIEGTISCLKRAYRLSKCAFRGFKDFCCGIGSAIFCHNVALITRQG